MATFLAPKLSFKQAFCFASLYICSYKGLKMLDVIWQAQN
jgi:hypothetical protein